ncbi:MAG: hypothetical protein R3C56_23855, partial [Pirellulaceae bacterium]
YLVPARRQSVDRVYLFNAEPQLAAGAQGERIDKWVTDEPQRIPTEFRGQRRRWHLRQPPS